jgi:hypothetical protein
MPTFAQTQWATSPVMRSRPRSKEERAALTRLASEADIQRCFDGIIGLDALSISGTSSELREQSGLTLPTHCSTKKCPIIVTLASQFPSQPS